jgi:hypothetical protein
MTWIEVVSDLVKIGSGAIIAGIITHLNSLQSHKRNVQNAYGGYRREILDSILLQTEKFYIAQAEYLNQVSILSTKDAFDLAVRPVVSESLSNSQICLETEIKGLIFADAKLCTLQDEELRRVCREYIECAQNFIESVEEHLRTHPRRRIERDIIDMYQAQLKYKREDFLKVLGESIKISFS